MNRLSLLNHNGQDSRRLRRRQAAPTRPALLSASAVAALLSIGVRTLYRLADAGQFPAPIRFSRKLIRWKASEVEAWLAEPKGGNHV